MAGRLPAVMANQPRMDFWGWLEWILTTASPDQNTRRGIRRGRTAMLIGFGETNRHPCGFKFCQGRQIGAGMRMDRGLCLPH